jgi:hypothetical protein
MAEIQGRAVAAAASVRSVHTSASSTATATNWAMRRQLFLQHQEHQPHSNAEVRALMEIMNKKLLLKKNTPVYSIRVWVFCVTRLTAENLYTTPTA